MLMLSRHVDKRIIIPSIKTEIVVTKIQQDRVWLGFDAPSDVVIMRKEIANREQSLRETHHLWSRGEEVSVRFCGQVVKATIVELCRTHRGYPAYRHTQPNGKYVVTSQDALLNVAAEDRSEQ